MKKYLIIPLAALLLAACEKEKEAPALTIEPVNLLFSAMGHRKHSIKYDCQFD